MSEQNVTGKMVAYLRGEGWQVQRVESRLMKGIPDINYCRLDGLEGWIEMKNCKKPPNRLELTPEQFLWLRTRARLNKRVFVVFYVESLKVYGLIKAIQFIKFTANPLLSELEVKYFKDLKQIIADLTE